jgi:hypothetical protein
MAAIFCLLFMSSLSVSSTRKYVYNKIKETVTEAREYCLVIYCKQNSNHDKAGTLAQY